MGAGRSRAKIHDRRSILMAVVVMLMRVVLMMLMMIVPVGAIMAMPVMMLMVIAMMMLIVVLMVMHCSIGIGMLMSPALRSAFDRRFSRRASANCAHQSTSSSLILSSSPEVICN
jgi:hypothetical protein